MKKLLRWINKKGISTDVLVIVLLIIGLVIAIILFISFGGYSKEGSVELLNLTYPLEEASGL